jgi:hypothetical protein
MITSDLLKLKNSITVNGTGIVDLSQPTFIINYDSGNYLVDKILIVNDDTEMRPDLISLASYGTDTYGEIIMKINQISNPFSIQAGDILIIPRLDYAKRFYTRPAIKDTNRIDLTKQKYLDPTRASKKDQRRLAKLLNMAKDRKNGAKEILPTNKLRTNEAPFKFVKGAILFGHNSKSPKI